jgi:signal transduction histidine kinase
MAIGIAAIYEAVGRDAARRLPAEAEAMLGSASKRAIEGSRTEGERLEEATESLIAARALLAEGRVMERDAIVTLALEVAAILAAVMAAAALAFFLLSRLITRGLDDLAAGAVLAQADRDRRFPPSSDPDLDAVARSLNELLDLAAKQEKRLAEAARLEGWREVASFLAHQLKNPLAALRIAAENASLAIGESEAQPCGSIAQPCGSIAQPCSSIAQPCSSMALTRESHATAWLSLAVIKAESGRLAALIDRFRDLAPSSLESHNASAETDLGALLAACAARAEISGAAVAISGQMEKVAGDRALLEQAFWNLFANSLEAGKEGSVGELRIDVKVSIEGREAVASLSDSSRGFDPELLPRLGRERITTKAEGTGLGLILVRRILAAQGGSLEFFATEADDRGRRGLGARVRLPLARRSR